MTVKRWSLTLLGCGLSLAWFVYCLWYVRSAWGLVSMGVLLVMAFQVLLDTVDLCCGRWLRGGVSRPAGPQIVRVRRVIFEEYAIGETAPGRLAVARQRPAAARRLAAGAGARAGR